jgi:hypothetical protein
MSSEMTLEVIPDMGNSRAGQRGSGYSVVPDWSRTSRHRAGVSPCVACWDEDTGEPWTLGVYVNQCLSLGSMGRPVSGKWHAGPRPEPDSGNPTVRDRREACGNVGYGDG